MLTGIKQIAADDFVFVQNEGKEHLFLRQGLFVRQSRDAEGMPHDLFVFIFGKIEPLTFLELVIFFEYRVEFMRQFDIHAFDRRRIYRLAEIFGKG